MLTLPLLRPFLTPQPLRPLQVADVRLLQEESEAKRRRDLASAHDDARKLADAWRHELQEVSARSELEVYRYTRYFGDSRYNRYCRYR